MPQSIYRARSKDSLGKLTDIVDDLDAQSSRTVATQLYEVLDLLSVHPSVISVWTDAALGSEHRVRLIDALLGSKLSKSTVEIIKLAVTSDWSSKKDLVDALKATANEANFLAAKKDGTLDQVSDELLKLASVLKSNSMFEQCLTDKSVELINRRNWFSRFLSGKVSAITQDLAINNFEQGLPGDALIDLAKGVAKIKGERIAHVTTASNMSSDQLSMLEKKLVTVFGSPIKMDPIVDEQLLGGAIVQVDFEVIDASVIGRLQQAANSI